MARSRIDPTWFLSFLAGSLLIHVLGCSGSGGSSQEPIDLALGQTVSRQVPGDGGMMVATLQVEANRTYGVSIALGERGFISISSNLVELLISGAPITETISVRTDQDPGAFQTAGLSLTPNIFFTAEQSGEVMFEVTNATQSSGTPFDLFTSTDTVVDIEVVDVTE